MKPVFIHVSKNAGKSIVATGGAHIISAGHRTASSWIEAKGSTHRLFAVVRNPFDRVVSEYFYRRHRYEGGESNPHLANLDKSFEGWTLATYRDGEYRTRSFFDATGVPYNDRNMIGDRLIWFLPQLEWLGDPEGGVVVADLLRFETLEDDWTRFAERNGLPLELAHRNSSARSRDYRGYYTDETRAVVTEYYRQDLDAFGYRF